MLCIRIRFWPSFSLWFRFPVALRKIPGQRISKPLILDYKGVRRAAKNWQIYSSDAPFRVPIPFEEKERDFRQLPIATDPPGSWVLPQNTGASISPSDPARLRKPYRPIDGPFDPGISIAARS